MQRKTGIPCGSLDIVVLLWIAYIGVYALCLPTEDYNLTYLFCSGLYYAGCVGCFRMEFFTLRGIGLTLTAIGIVQCMVCILQFLGTLPSYSILFPVTGTLVDPNLTAMLIAWGIPFVFHSLLTVPRNRKLLCVVLFLFLATLLLLKCRTAYVSVVFSLFFIWGKEKRWHAVYNRQSLSKKTAILGGICAVILTFSVGLYFYKQPSADGRLFIWKVSCTMIGEKPLTGYGYGLFEKSYNVAQRQILDREEATPKERKNARFTMLAFNDFIEQTVSGGLVGGILFTGMVCLAVCFSFRQKESWVPACCGGVWIGMAVNFVVQSVVLWMGALTLFAWVSAVRKPIDFTRSVRRLYSVGIPCALCLLSLFCSYRLFRTYPAQRTLKKATLLYTSDPQGALSLLEKSLSQAGTSECYLRYYARMLVDQGKGFQAKELLEKARKYTAHPAIERELK